MSNLFTELSEATSKVRWINKKGGNENRAGVEVKKFTIQPNWPMAPRLEALLYGNKKAVSGRKPSDVGSHIFGVIASVNELIDETFEFVPSTNIGTNHDAQGLLATFWKFFMDELAPATPEGEDARKYIEGLLRIAALYHDVGKLISNDRHVSRGVHLMRDINDDDRKAFENDIFLGDFRDKQNFWTLLRHHDIFGSLCTGEASLPSIFETISWAGQSHAKVPVYKGTTAYLSYLVVLNIADSDSSLFFSRFTPHVGLPTIEARRYLGDWKILKDYLWEQIEVERKNDYVKREQQIKREEFKTWLLEMSSHPEYAIKRIGRIIITAYRMCLPTEDVNENMVERLVEDELQMLHGPRIEQFCYLFTRFCKIDYGLRFFQVLMMHELLEKGENLVDRKDRNEPDYLCPSDIVDTTLGTREREERKQRCIARMVHRTCQVFERIVKDYGHLVRGEQRSSPLLCVVMAGLMPENERNTAWAICSALKKNSSRALGWISDEVGVGLYGE